MAVPKLPLVLSFFANAIIDAGVGVAVLLLIHNEVELSKIFGLIFRRYHHKLLGNGIVGPLGTRVLVDDILRLILNDEELCRIHAVLVPFRSLAVALDIWRTSFNNSFVDARPGLVSFGCIIYKQKQKGACKS